jgi:hypothetical protein
LSIGAIVSCTDRVQLHVDVVEVELVVLNALINMCVETARGMKVSRRRKRNDYEQM